MYIKSTESEGTSGRLSNLVDHVQGALKHGVENLGDFCSDVGCELVDDGRHGAEHFGFSSGGDVPLIVDQYGLEQRGDKVLPDLNARQK